MSLLDLTLEAGIPGDVMWSLIDGKHIVSVPHQDGLLVDKVDDGRDGEIDGMAALDRITREVKRLSKSVQKINDRQPALNRFRSWALAN